MMRANLLAFAAVTGAKLPSRRPPTPMVLFYVDDSGDEQLRTFSAIGIPVERWSAASAQWLAWRRRLSDEHGVDVRYRLHATHWVAGRGRPTLNPRHILNRSRAARWQIYVSALDTLAAIPGLIVLTVARLGGDVRTRTAN